MKTEYIEIHDSFVLAKFDGFLSSEEFLSIAKDILIALEKYKFKSALINLKKMEVMKKEIQVWIKTQWFPKAKKAGLKRMAFVKPQNMFGYMSMQFTNSIADSDLDLNICYFDELDEAREWIISFV